MSAEQNEAKRVAKELIDGSAVFLLIAITERGETQVSAPPDELLARGLAHKLSEAISDMAKQQAMLAMMKDGPRVIPGHTNGTAGLADRIRRLKG